MDDLRSQALPDEPYSISLGEFAAIVGVARLTLQRWAAKGVLDGMGITLPGGARRFRRSEVDAFIDGLRRPPAEASAEASA